MIQGNNFDRDLTHNALIASGLIAWLSYIQDVDISNQ
jgi:hypothetical protein